jgi:hypothetical protein
MGRYRDQVDGFPIDASGELDGDPLRDALDLADRLADDARVTECVARQLFRHATGRLETPGENPAFTQILAAAQAAGYDFRALMVALVTSEAFRMSAPPDSGDDGGRP